MPLKQRRPARNVDRIPALHEADEMRVAHAERSRPHEGTGFEIEGERIGRRGERTALPVPTRRSEPKGEPVAVEIRSRDEAAERFDDQVPLPAFAKQEPRDAAGRVEAGLSLRAAD